MFAAPGQLRVANAPGFSQAIEFIALPGGTSTSSPAYSGTFYSWFQDGASFITRTGSNVATIYSHDGVLLSTANHSQFQGLGGEGNWFWAHSTSFVEIFAVGGASTPAATYTFATNNYSRLLASGSTIALIQGTANYINVIDLTGSVPQLVARTTTTFNNSSYAARSPTDWIHGNESGVLSGAPGSALPVHYTYGRARSIAGSRTRAAVATSTGQILFFNAARSLEGTIAFDSSKLALSNDGNVLGAEANDSEGLLFTDRTLRMYSLPSGAVLAEWPGSTNDTDVPVNFELSGSGDVAGQVTQREVGTGIFETTRRTVRFDNTVLWSQSAGSGSRLLLSTSGLRVAVPNGDGFDTGSSTNIYSNGVFSGSIAAAPVCWLDDARLLVTRYNSASSRSPLIIDPSGQTVATPGGPLPELRVCQPLDTNTIYSPELNDILNLTTGLPVWSSQAESSQMLGAATDAYVAFASGATVRAESR